MASPAPTFSTILVIVGSWCGFVRPNCSVNFARTVDL
jgi:hypothetical protein